MLRLLLVLWTLAEIAALVAVGQAVGVLGVLALVVLTAALGGLLVRRAGQAALGALRRGVAPRPGAPQPLAGLLAGGFTLLAGLLLVLPGFLGDVAGLLLLLPPLQRLLLRRLSARVPRATVIEAEWREVTPGAPDAPDAPDAAGPGLPRATHPSPRTPSGWTRH